MRKLSRSSASSVTNDAVDTITVTIDDDAFLLPPGASIQITRHGLIYLGYPGDAPMLAWPIRRSHVAA